MKAIEVSEFGNSNVLKYKELKDPVMKDDEIYVALKAAAVNPVETYVRQGTYAQLPSLPYIPGKDGAGIVKAVGKRVKNFKVGDRVFVTVDSDAQFETYAQAITCKATEATLLPENMTYSQGAAVGSSGLTALYALKQKAALKSGEYILVHGATGGVGTLVLQFAKLYGAKVIATAGSENGLEILKKLGADYVFNHHAEGYIKEIQDVTKNHGLDVIVEMLANVNLQKDLEVIGNNGRIVIIGNRGEVTINPRVLMMKGAHITGLMLANITPEEVEKNTQLLLQGLSEGVKPVIDKVFPLEQAARAQDYIMENKGSMGKIILDTTAE
ncbi:NADPH:quinone reductase [Lactococcus garvieae]|uniref:NADPH:quinone reductase n=1 Tax=Lactococcus garvieae TaxID=1363 RepID=UPI003852F429